MTLHGPINRATEVSVKTNKCNYMELLVGTLSH